MRNRVKMLPAELPTPPRIPPRSDRPADIQRDLPPVMDSMFDPPAPAPGPPPPPPPPPPPGMP
uniref:Uncharacterized protein n=1 Tax=Anopheles minimus TaxID=112268 RepID=A0A182WHV5_9DIPT